MERLLVALAITAVVVVVALILARRRPDPPSSTTFTVPAQLDRDDFERPDAPWLVAVFTSASCETCGVALAKALPLSSEVVAVQEAEFGRNPDLHRRYHIDAVPAVVVADVEGVVRASFLGSLTATDLWATVAELREPGSTPDACDHGQPPTS